MAPFKSSLARSATKLFGVFRERDTSLRGFVSESRRLKTSILTVPSSIDASQEWDLEGNPLVITSANSFDISVNPKSGGDVAVKTHIWGAGGGGGGSPPSPSNGGAGGFTVGDFTLVTGTTYKFVVGNSSNSSSDSGSPSGFGEHAGAGGGYSGVFTTSVSQPNAIILAGGGGGAGGNDAGSHGNGGGGGGSTGQDASGSPIAASDGDGGTQSAGGSGGPGSNQNGTSGTALTGGAGGARGTNGGGGGGGGSGYFGGGGGGGVSGGNTGAGGGGGGSGYLHPSLVTNGTTTQATSNSRIETSPFTPSIPSNASKGNDDGNSISTPSAAYGGLGCIVIEFNG
tara:strand:+ start:14 stop:1036 length:1023 start_codon:yes stop_codon:yes gene_type:complete